MLFDTIKKLCKEQGLSVSEVEKNAGLGNGTIRGWNESSPTVDNLQAVAMVLNTTVDNLLKLKDGGE